MAWEAPAAWRRRRGHGRGSGGAPHDLAVARDGLADLGVDDVATSTAEEPVDPRAAGEDIVPAQAVEPVVARLAEDQIGPLGATEHVRPRRADDRAG